MALHHRECTARYARCAAPRPAAAPPPRVLLFRATGKRILQLAPAVQVQLATAGALYGWRDGLLKSVTPLAAAEDAKDLQFDAEVDAIRLSAAAGEDADAGVGGDGDDSSEGMAARENGVAADEAKELAAV